MEKLKTDNFVLRQRANNEREKFNEIKKEKFLLEADMELREEMYEIFFLFIFLFVLDIYFLLGHLIQKLG